MHGVPNKIPVSVSLPVELLQALSKYAATVPATRSGLVALAVTEFLARKENGSK